MRMATCEACGVRHPLAETIAVQDKTLCQACAEEFARQRGGSDDLARQVDPTICANCGADNGEQPHELLVGLPACGTCIAYYRNRPFPGWVRVGFAALLALVIVSLVWNWRFFQAYFEVKAAFATVEKGDFSGAARNASAAAAHVPEVPDLQEFASFFEGLLCLQEDQCEKAEVCFGRCTHMPPDFGVQQLRQQAALGAAFKRKDYDRFLQLAEQMAHEQPNNPVFQAQVASALACQYAVRGDPDLRRRAEAKLEAAKKIGNEALQESRYEERIRHRLETREVISGKQFMERFPNGWHPNGGAKS